MLHDIRQCFSFFFPRPSHSYSSFFVFAKLWNDSSMWLMRKGPSLECSHVILWRGVNEGVKPCVTEPHVTEKKAVAFFWFSFFGSTQMNAAERTGLNRARCGLWRQVNSCIFYVSERHQQEHPHSTQHNYLLSWHTLRDNLLELKEPNVLHSTNRWHTQSHLVWESLQCDTLSSASNNLLPQPCNVLAPAFAGDAASASCFLESRDRMCCAMCAPRSLLWVYHSIYPVSKGPADMQSVH